MNEEEGATGKGEKKLTNALYLPLLMTYLDDYYMCIKYKNF